jgi:Sulfatase-modifying factor enzyme 1
VRRLLILLAFLGLTGCISLPEISDNPPRPVDDTADASTIFIATPLNDPGTPPPAPTPTIAPVPVPPPAPPLVDNACPADMVHIQRDGVNFCIDTYEAPNKKGEYPLYAQDYYSADAYCKAEDKRLPTENEWEIACEGSHHYAFPYGNTYQYHTCNTDKTGYIPVPWDKMSTPQWPAIAKSLFKGDPSGSRENCRTDEGVYDMSGNVAEITDSPSSPYGMSVHGCFWFQCYGGMAPSCKFANRAHSKSFNSYEFGFRCVLPLNN